MLATAILPENLAMHFSNASPIGPQSDLFKLIALAVLRLITSSNLVDA
jgi:hypothetical protein